MTYKQKLEDQIGFAQKKMKLVEKEGFSRELHLWSGYIQGLRYAVAEIEVDKPVIVKGASITKCPYPNECVYPNCKCQEMNPCQCSPTDLQPFGECVCGKMLN